MSHLKRVVMTLEETNLTLTNSVNGDKLKEKDIENLITNNVDCDEQANQDENFDKKKIQKRSHHPPPLLS